MADEAGTPGTNTGEAGPEKVFTQEQFEGLIKDRVTRERKRIQAELSSELRANLLVDDEFRKQALKEWKFEPPKSNGKPDDDTVKVLFGEWEKEHLTPVKSRAEQLEGELGKLRRSQLESDILAAAGGRIQKALLKKASNGHSALFNILEQDFVYDDQSGEWRVRGKDGAFRPSSGGERLYMTPDEYLAGWMQTPDAEPFVLNTTQTGANFAGNKGDGGKRTYTREEYHRLTSDAEYYASHRDELLAAVREGRVR